MEMFKTYNLKTAFLSLFIKSMGSGFSEVICKYYSTGEITKNNFKQKFKKMNSGDKNIYQEITSTLGNLQNLFTAPKMCTPEDDDTFCEKDLSDKYYFSFARFIPVFINAAYTYEYFFYESFENALSYLLTSSFNNAFSPERCVETLADGNLDSLLGCKEILASAERYGKAELYGKTYTIDEIKKEFDLIKRRNIRCYRHEYGPAVNDVRSHKKENKTFFKWAIDSFFDEAKKADDIIKYIFGENDGSFTTTFEKLKYEPGKRNWKTFEKLFKNELKDEKLMDYLKDDEDLKAYEIFQTRMISAYFLENLFAELPHFVGEENAKEIEKIIVLDDSRKEPDDFLVKNHKQKSQAYEKAAFDAVLSDSYEEAVTKLQALDKNCPATQTIKSYCACANPWFKYEMSREKLAEAFENCNRNCHFLTSFSDYDLNGIIWK